MEDEIIVGVEVGGQDIESSIFVDIEILRMMVRGMLESVSGFRVKIFMEGLEVIQRGYRRY